MYNLTHALIDRTRSAAAGSFMRSRKSVNDSAAPAEAASTASASASDCDDAICFFFSFLFSVPFLSTAAPALRFRCPGTETTAKRPCAGGGWSQRALAASCGALERQSLQTRK